MPARLLSAESTDLFVGSEAEPHQVLKVTVRQGGRETPLDVRGRGVSCATAVSVPPGVGALTLEVPLRVSAPPGTTVPCRVTLGDEALEAEVTAERPGWTMHMVSHFHYDPVWWNTQAAYTSPWELLAGDSTTRPLWERNAFALVEAHIELALRDPDYRFVLAEVDYLKPFFDVHPERRADLRALLREERVELVGGTYNEPNTNLTGAETTIRNLVYGIGYQRDILGGDPRTAWQLDVFGHDPQFPGYLAAAGLSGSAWARGPFHQWGPISKNFGPAKDDAAVMQFPSEFEWISPSGLGVLTHYMPAHYSAGWWMDSSPTLEEAAEATYRLYRSLKPVAATRHILLPVGTDYTPPNKWVTDIHRSWAERYVWPRFVCSTPKDFLRAVREETSAFSPQTRDMNPVYTGKDVSYIDTKQAQRAAEVAALDAERLSAFAALLGLGRYPHTALDKVWRQLAYGAHHDAITGSESDQVYIDLLTGWREAHDLAADARDRALAALTGRIAVDGPSVVVTNTLPFARDGLVRVRVAPGLRPGDAPAVYEDGTLTFLARDVPSMGWRTYPLTEGAPGAWQPMDGTTIENGRWRVTADPARGGGLTSILDRSSERELLTGLGNELRLYDEYPQHPDMGEGPWHLMPTGVITGSGSSSDSDSGSGSGSSSDSGSGSGSGSGFDEAEAAVVRAQVSPLGQRLTVTGRVGDLAYEQVITLLTGSDRIDFGTRVLDHTGADRLLRVRFPAQVEGALPVSDVAGAVVGRGFALPDVDSARHPWTLDNPANTWFGLSATARVDLGEAGARALGVAEVVVPRQEDAPLARDLVVALARAGVTATTSSATGPRYGWLDVDSNLPDVRLILGGPDDNPLAAELLDRSDPAYRDALKAGARAVWVPAERPLAEVWQPSADLRDVRALPALIVAGPLPSLVSWLVEDLADATIEAVCPLGGERLEDRTVALLTYGLPGFAVDPSGALHLSLMRSCTGWPSGIWLDPPRRTAPDGSAFQLQHWTHEFSYALTGGEGDWRARALPAAGQDFITPLLPRVVDGPGGESPPVHSLLSVEPARDVLLGTLKATGNPHAHGLARHDASGVTIRLVESTGLGSTAVLHSPILQLDRLTRSDLLERPGEPVRDLVLAGAEVATFLVHSPPPSERGGTAEAARRALGSTEVTTRPVTTEATARPALETGAGQAPPELGASETGAGQAPPELGATAEVAQPVYSRYWLHNKGPAPLGYLPVSIAVTPGLVTPSEAFEVSVVVSSHLVDAAHEGVVDVLVPDGWAATPARRVFRLEAGGHLRFPVTVTPGTSGTPGAPVEPGTTNTPGTGQGLHFVSVRTSAGGQQVEDVVTVALGDAPSLPTPGPLPAPGRATHGTMATEGPVTGLSVSPVEESLSLRPGERSSIEVRLTNGTSGEIRGEAQLAAPWGTWDLLPEVIRGFSLPPGESVTVGFPVEVPEDAPAGHAWAMAKVMWFGRCQYTPAIRLEVTR
ncbi:NEW3 domain-containing protein [Nonomuraea cavernae]|uniref:Alpha-mannosidase n=1 Tax=Nonomuraea cavernae TaxID=2045107 RepID=A0A918DLX8_9ACTN|nr:NEW3 domain-containing protein [Nonomuraea cavernae]MCA2188727.1 glycoside hydrolase [Nonomuraea cavernae]GGO74161.1 alpha-mannosidase [Nonomuraea cavernae]